MLLQMSSEIAEPHGAPALRPAHFPVSGLHTGTTGGILALRFVAAAGEPVL
jgi:hypothetical protein